MIIKKVCYCVILCLCCLTALAQETHFTQQYANKLYLNPAFAGLNHSWSATLTHRNQWPALNGSFVTNQFAADYRLENSKSAINLVVHQDRAGVGGLQKLQATAGYAYHTALTDKWAMSVGLQASVASLSINYDNLVFGDQLSDNGQIALTSAEAARFEPRSYASFAVGGLFYADQFWLGLKVANLNRPAYGFEEKTRLPLDFLVNAGYKFYARSYEERGQLFELSFTPSATYIQQNNFRRVDLGLHTIYTPLTLGIIYKGIPVVTGTNQDQALSVIAGLQLEGFKVGFSHDIGLSGLSKQVGGANEITLAFEHLEINNLFGSRRGRKINRSIPCPAF
ncbi:PorP/SprF family type IX secretion system membrane protein [uncultured Pontibacter sp.]|uniref:PorP/SprF family type IX secretion system membrane protein n=1 Tax=uncultured Pontibacter sp. TaxID=453356 RepID=UPI002613DD3F|nr:PorP/SprF family type IX secretion system membrane protein [uncultured Pontibacter sp.]